MNQQTFFISSGCWFINLLLIVLRETLPIDFVQPPVEDSDYSHLNWANLRFQTEGTLYCVALEQSPKNRAAYTYTSNVYQEQEDILASFSSM